MERRNTEQREVVLNAVRTLRSHVTAEEVYNFVKENHPNIGKGTVYRNLGILSENGEIRKVEVPNGPDRFDFTLKDHYHIQCVKCGAVSDVDMDVIEDIKERIKDPQGFDFFDHGILFKGICPKCKRGGEING